MGQLVGITAALALIAAVGFGTGVVDMLVPEAPEPVLSHPLPYSVTIQDCLPSGRQCSPVRHYFAKGAQ